MEQLLQTVVDKSPLQCWHALPAPFMAELAARSLAIASHAIASELRLVFHAHELVSAALISEENGGRASALNDDGVTRKKSRKMGCTPSTKSWRHLSQARGVRAFLDTCMDRLEHFVHRNERLRTLVRTMIASVATTTAGSLQGVRGVSSDANDVEPNRVLASLMLQKLRLL